MHSLPETALSLKLVTEDGLAFSHLLRQKRIGLLACESVRSAMAPLLFDASASFADVDVTTCSPGDAELERYHALILNIGVDVEDSAWLRPEALRTNSRPLMLAGTWDDICSRISLQEYSDEVIFAPFNPRELIFRLCRLTSAKEKERPAVKHDRPCVLIADDDGELILYLKAVLRDLGVDVHLASDGQAALVATRKLLPDLLVLDVSMPQMNGIEVLRCLRADPGTRGIAAILLTGSTDPSDVEKSAELGASDYILKPFGHIELIRKLKSLLHQLSTPVTANPRKGVFVGARHLG